jgi:hypothetical protein
MHSLMQLGWPTCTNDCPQQQVRLASPVPTALFVLLCCSSFADNPGQTSETVDSNNACDQLLRLNNDVGHFARLQLIVLQCFM